MYMYIAQVLSIMRSFSVTSANVAVIDTLYHARHPL